MGSKFHRLQWGCFFLLFFFIAGCAMRQGVKEPERGKDFLQETSRLEKLAREDPQASVRAQSHLELAFLFLNHRNPQLNYARALQEIESFFSLSPDKAQADHILNWLAVLREMDHRGKDRVEMEKKIQGLQTQMERLQASLEKAQKVNASLRDEVGSLKEMNSKMIETLERLKSLDLQMEEKRRLVK
ncbi:MAG TPA: hypothetical protein VLK23_02535 [Thermodesulfobacteriota bacterium]|nr:hypothetical protein [Thermodesulfobacteriota bacterium]